MAIAGSLGFDEVAEANQLVAALGRMSLHASDRSVSVQRGPCCLGAVSGGCLWQSGGELPDLAAVFEGDLYERTLLIEQLSLQPNANDAEIAAKAYLHWGELFPDHLYGEFSLAVWDGSRHRLLLARDALSRVSLFYNRTEAALRFGSEQAALLGWPGVDDSIDDVVIAAILAVEPQPGRTLYRGVNTVKGGHVMLQDGSGGDVQVLSYWHPLRLPELHVRDWREYAVALREAMVNAVAVRLPAEGLVGSQMSSGFDSSSVSALAAQALARQNRPLVAYTSVPRRRTDASAVSLNRFDDEWPLAAQVAAMYPNVEHVPIYNDAAAWWDSLDVSAKFAGAPGFIRNSRWYTGILQDAQRRGLVTMLEGQAGNLTGSYAGGFGLYDLRRKGEWRQLLRAVRNRRRNGEMWKTMIGDVWMPAASTKAFLQRLRGKKMPKLFELSMMRQDFYEASGLKKKKLSAMGSVIEGDRSNGRAWRFSILEKMDMGLMRTLHMGGFGLRREDPTADRRLVELCLSIPDEWFAPEGVKRQLYREGFRNDLPAELLAEKGRGLQSSDFLEMFEEWIPEWRAELDRQDASESVGRYLDLPRMRQLLDDWPKMIAGNRAAADTAYNYSFGGALAMGRMLRSRDEARKANAQSAL